LCFICLLLYVATIVSRCFKSRSGVEHVIRERIKMPKRGGELGFSKN
jgi:hypothetical protein